MGVSFIELSAVSLLTLIVVLVIALRRGKSLWLLTLPLCLGVAVVATPADPLSTVWFLLRLLTPAWLLG